MSSIPPPSFAPRPKPKGSIVVAYALCPVLLAISCYGFSQWVTLPSHTELIGLGELYYLMCLVVIPLVLFLFLSVVAAQRLEYDRLSSSYQIRIDHLQKRLNAQEDLLHTVTDHDPESVAIFDKNNCFWFVNQSAAQFMGLDVKDVIGKTPTKILGHDRARILEARLNQVRTSGKSIESLDQRNNDKGAVRFLQAHYEVIEKFGDFTGGVIVRAEDVTRLIVERERRESMLRQLIATMVAVVDRRDPFASGHSARVGQLSRAIAEEMVLNEIDIETSEIAGSLMNFGKVLVPRSILTKATALTADELQNVRDSILTSADILSIIEFTGSVVPTLRQVLERFNGSGVPKGLKGDEILVTARIIAVANTFVALVSPRAHRPSLGFREAVEIIMKDSDTLYDRRVVVALANYIENRTSKLDWLATAKQA